MARILSAYKQKKENATADCNKRAPNYSIKELCCSELVRVPEETLFLSLKVFSYLVKQGIFSSETTPHIIPCPWLQSLSLETLTGTGSLVSLPFQLIAADVGYENKLADYKTI